MIEKGDIEFQREKAEQHFIDHPEDFGKYPDNPKGKMMFIKEFYLYKGKRPTRKEAKLIYQYIRESRQVHTFENGQIARPYTVTECYIKIQR